MGAVDRHRRILARARGGGGRCHREATGILAGLGAVKGVNPAGGGSTTFVVAGSVRNRPSDGSQRPVSSALVVLRK